MRPELFLEIAKEWSATKGDCEAHNRSSTSRAYYAALHSCQEALKALGIHPDEFGGSHQKIIEALKQSGDKELVSLGNKLKDLKVMRESADYDICFPVPKQNYQVAIRKAENILERCNHKTRSDVGT